jgi:UDP-GlcNAc:undecaprenyl-phosphate GlcNAc-1-phosphate transferase
MLLSLAGMALLAYLADGIDILVVMLAVMGAIVGFLRFNTYPARVFMGDTGSQFLGFTVVTLLIILTQKTSSVLNPALPLWLLGVPLFDTAFVVIRRIYYGQSPFVADRNHVHHQLLARNLDHYEAVVIIYLVQALFVLTAIFLRYHSDLLIVSLWVLVNMALAYALVMAGRLQWQAHPAGAQSVFARAMRIGKRDVLCKASLAIILGGISLLLFAGPLLADVVDRDLGIVAGVLFLLLLLRQLLGASAWFISLRLMMFVVIAFVLYLLGEYPFHAYPALEGFDYVFFGLIVVALAIGTRATDRDVFQTTPLDFLLILIMISMVFIPQARAGDDEIIHLAIKMGIMFYAVEFVLRNLAGRWNFPAVSALWALGVIAVRGLVL